MRDWHKKQNRCSFECHVEIFQTALSPTKAHLPPSHHDSARQLATISFSAVTRQGSHANHSHTQVLGSWLLRMLVVNIPADVNGGWELECTPVMLRYLMLLWHTAVKWWLQGEGWHRNGQLPLSPHASHSLSAPAQDSSFLLKLQEDNISQSHQPSSAIGVSFQKRTVADTGDRGSRQTLFSPKKQEECFVVQIS